jgi:hypothetical protein
LEKYAGPKKVKRVVQAEEERIKLKTLWWMQDG